MLGNGQSRAAGSASAAAAAVAKPAAGASKAQAPAQSGGFALLASKKSQGLANRVSPSPPAVSPVKSSKPKTQAAAPAKPPAPAPRRDEAESADESDGDTLMMQAPRSSGKAEASAEAEEFMPVPASKKKKRSTVIDDDEDDPMHTALMRDAPPQSSSTRKPQRMEIDSEDEKPAEADEAEEEEEDEEEEERPKKKAPAPAAKSTKPVPKPEPAKKKAAASYRFDEESADEEEEEEEQETVLKLVSYGQGEEDPFRRALASFVGYVVVKNEDKAEMVRVRDALASQHPKPEDAVLKRKFEDLEKAIAQLKTDIIASCRRKKGVDKEPILNLVSRALVSCSLQRPTEEEQKEDGSFEENRVCMITGSKNAVECRFVAHPNSEVCSSLYKNNTSFNVTLQWATILELLCYLTSVFEHIELDVHGAFEFRDKRNRQRRSKAKFTDTDGDEEESSEWNKQINEMHGDIVDHVCLCKTQLEYAFGLEPKEKKPKG